MSIDIQKPETQEEADHRAMLDHAFRRKPADPDVLNRVRARADRIREELQARGTRIDAVELIRSSREDL